MANEFRGVPAHSAEHFGDTRDHWWNADFIEMIGRRWRAERLQRVLDVGCGVGHWGRALARILPETATLVGVDREPLWVGKAAERATAACLANRFEYRRPRQSFPETRRNLKGRQTSATRRTASDEQPTRDEILKGRQTVGDWNQRAVPHRVDRHPIGDVRRECPRVCPAPE